MIQGQATDTLIHHRGPPTIIFERIYSKADSKRAGIRKAGGPEYPQKEITVKTWNSEGVQERVITCEKQVFVLNNGHNGKIT
jgi:hypothetical protein